MEKHPKHVNPISGDSVEYFAHIDCATERVQLLRDHLESVAEQSAKFAAEFDSSEWGYIAGLFHDLGKYDQSWQDYLKYSVGYDMSKKGKKGQHSRPGAIALIKKAQEVGWSSGLQLLLAYAVAGHHAGLADWSLKGGTLQERLYQEGINQPLHESLLRDSLASEEAQRIYEQPLPLQFPLVDRSQLESLPLWTRMIFSCVTDADSLDTEKFMNNAGASLRGGFDSLFVLSEKLDSFLEEKRTAAASTTLNFLRQEILHDCQFAALQAPGFFSLTVPTGGGKTLSSLSFALRHALAHHKKRVIVAIPFTSIIEQTALVYKYGTDNVDEIAAGAVLFGEQNVLEHHSSFVIKDDESEEYQRHQLTMENWDVPVVVTTNVQLFESLHSCRKSQCRKLHNIANSVIILDEAQSLPEQYLQPILKTLEVLVRDFKVTVVFSTATQPAFEGYLGQQPRGFLGIEGIREIIQKPNQLATSLSRTEIKIDDRKSQFNSWTELAEKLDQYDQVLCIVNTRQDCVDLYRAMLPDDTWYLSGLMCPAERAVRISKIKKKLRGGDRVRVISTQLIEAGVDIDFPVVYRALTGLDSIAQSAGRCNREGCANSKGIVSVFWPPPDASKLRGSLRRATDSTISLMNAGELDFANPEMFRSYFRRYYSDVPEFGKQYYDECLQNNLTEAHFEFRSYSDKFCLIDDALQRTVLVRYQNKEAGVDNSNLIEELRNCIAAGHSSMRVMRQLQPFSVSIPDYKYRELLDKKYAIEEIGGVGVQLEKNLYVAGEGLDFDCEMSVLYVG
ncbi:MAG: CRISPR-associated helicase Cas3' [Raoultibacter sp.]